MALTVGSRLAHYDVTSLIGEGGMGQVWQATDTKLNRQVALKILPEAFAADPDRLARFQREAQVLASLNHPNIAAIHGIEEADDTRALVLELVEGPTLADRIAQGPIPVDETLPIAKQIAEALEAAHDAGVIHRDLKPANIKVREDGTVKVLDFGLAKALQGEGSADPSESPTLTAAATATGVIMGTAAYMAPEQAKGRLVDKRADVWAFGAVLFEMLTGRRAFGGQDVTETLAEVIKSTPDWEALPPELSPTTAIYLRRCLEKEPKQRVHDVADVRLAMEGAFETASEPHGVAAGMLRVWLWQRPVPATIAAFCLLGLGAVSMWGLLRPTVTSEVYRVERFDISPSAPRTVSSSSDNVAISPDGSHVVYRAVGSTASQLFVRPVDRLDATVFEGLTDVTGPFFSPDSAWVGFFDDTGNHNLNRLSVFGGPPVIIGRVPGGFLQGASWGEDDTIVLGTLEPSGLWSIPVSGGQAEPFTTPDPQRAEENHTWPHVLPGGRGVLYTAGARASVDDAVIAVLDLNTGEQKELIARGSYPKYSSTGHIVYAAAGTLRAVGFDLERLEVTNRTPVPILDGVVMNTANGAASFALARDGTLVYVAGSGAQTNELVWVNRDGDEEPVGVRLGRYARPRISPDGTHVVVDNAGKIWIHDLSGQAAPRLLTESGNRPQWTAGGQDVMFRVADSGLFLQRADGTGRAEQLVASAALEDFTVSNTGTTVVFAEGDEITGTDLYVSSLAEDQPPEVLLDTPFVDEMAALSPDGQWLAYVSDEFGQENIVVVPFPDVGGGRWTISTDGGREPVWNPDGQELFYRGRLGVMAVRVATEPAFRPGVSALLFDDIYPRGGGTMYDVTPDGERFLMVKQSATDTKIILVKHWSEELQRLVPTN